MLWNTEYSECPSYTQWILNLETAAETQSSCRKEKGARFYSRAPGGKSGFVFVSMAASSTQLYPFRYSSLMSWLRTPVLELNCLSSNPFSLYREANHMPGQPEDQVPIHFWRLNLIFNKNSIMSMDKPKPYWTSVFPGEFFSKWKIIHGRKLHEFVIAMGFSQAPTLPLTGFVTSEVI